MLERAPFNYSEAYIEDYIANYLKTQSSPLLNEEQLRLIIQLLINGLETIMARYWQTSLTFSRDLLERLYAIVTATNDEVTEEANQRFIGIFEPMFGSANPLHSEMRLYLNQIWQLCQGRLDSLKLDRIGQSCNWIEPENVFIARARKANNQQRIILVKQIIQFFFKDALDATKTELKLREQEAQSQQQATTPKTRVKHTARLFSESEIETMPDLAIPSNSQRGIEIARIQTKRCRMDK